MPRTDIEKLTAERLASARKMLDDYLAFQRSRPDLPQGEFDTLSNGDLKKVTDAFALERARPTLEKLSGAERRRMEKAVLTGKLTVRTKPSR